MASATQQKLMQYRIFGRTGLRASQFILGAMTFGDAGDFGSVSNVFPILGAKRLDQFNDNVAALDIRLSSDQLERLNSVSAVELGFPHDFLASALEGKLPVNIFGVPRERIDLSRHNF